MQATPILNSIHNFINRKHPNSSSNINRLSLPRLDSSRKTSSIGVLNSTSTANQESSLTSTASPRHRNSSSSTNRTNGIETPDGINNLKMCSKRRAFLSKPTSRHRPLGTSRPPRRISRGVVRLYQHQQLV